MDMKTFVVELEVLGDRVWIVVRNSTEDVAIVNAECITTGDYHRIEEVTPDYSSKEPAIAGALAVVQARDAVGLPFVPVSVTLHVSDLE